VYIAPADRPVDDAQVRAFLEAQGFGHLVAGGGPDRPVPVVVPTQYVLDGDDLLVHLARPNPIWTALEENPVVVLSVAGDWAFIPSAWKAIGDEDPALGIPTTYYGAVQVEADAEVLTEPDAVAEVLRRQLAALQPDVPAADPTVHGPRLAAIHAIRLRPRTIRAKFKYGGNVDQAHRDAVAARLQERNGPGDAAALTHLRRR